MPTRFFLVCGTVLAVFDTVYGQHINFVSLGFIPWLACLLLAGLVWSVAHHRRQKHSSAWRVKRKVRKCWGK